MSKCIAALEEARRMNRVVGSVGDANWPWYGGGPVYQTEHGFTLEYVDYVDPEYVDPSQEEESGVYTIYRIDLDQHVPDWGDINNVARGLGGSPVLLKQAFESDDPLSRANAYLDWAGFYGWHEFDQDPLVLNKEDVNRRYFATHQALAKLAKRPQEGELERVARLKRKRKAPEAVPPGASGAAEARSKTGPPVRYKDDLFEVLAWNGDARGKDMVHGYYAGKDAVVVRTHQEARDWANAWMNRNQPISENANVRISKTTRSGDTYYHEKWLGKYNAEYRTNVWTFIAIYKGVTGRTVEPELERVARLKQAGARETFRYEQQPGQSSRPTSLEARDTTCQPFTRVVRDPEKLSACQARAKGPIENSRAAYDLVRADLERNDQETFVVLCLDFRGQVRDYAQVAMGQRHRVAVDVEDILAVVLLSRADGVVVAHSHPSGVAEPSDADCDLTEAIRNAMAVACPNIRFLDHCVVGSGEFYSFADHPPKKNGKGAWEIGKVTKVS